MKPSKDELTMKPSKDEKKAAFALVTLFIVAYHVIRFGLIAGLLFLGGCWLWRHL